MDYNDYTPLDYATEFNHRDVAYLIKNNGGVLNNNLNNAKLFNQLAIEGNLESLKTFYDCGANLLSTDYNNRNIAHIAASEGKHNIIECLLFELKLDIIMEDKWGNTPYSEGDKIIKELIRRRYRIGNY